MNVSGKLIASSVIAALGGFLFGFDTVVISGAEQTIESLWELSPQMHGWAMSSALWGMVLGSLIGGWPTDRFGRKATLLMIGVFFLVGSLWSALANEVYSFMLARFLGGIAVGVSTIAAPLYISEIAPPARRGQLAGMFQFNIVFGILIAFLSNYLLGKLGENSWRWMLGIMAIPSLIYSLACFFIPESPRWLIARKGDRAAGVKVMKEISPETNNAEIEHTADQLMIVGAQSGSSAGFWRREMRKPILIAFLVAFFNQLSGINAILYFAPRIFQMAGLGQQAALLNSVGIGVTNLIFTFVGLWLIDRCGRRTLLYLGSLGYIASLGLCAWTFFHWAPEFRVAASAADVAGISERLANPDSPNRAKAEQDLAHAKRVFNAAASDPALKVEVKQLSADADFTALKQAAEGAIRMTMSSNSASLGSQLVLACIFAFIAAHAIGQGAVIWVLISEIFPERFRATGQALGSFTHWIFAALLTKFFPLAIQTFPPGNIFLFFCCMMFLQLLWVQFMVPETKGVSLEEIQKQFNIT